jgi:hypothetical protein
MNGGDEERGAKFGEGEGADDECLRDSAKGGCCCCCELEEARTMEWGGKLLLPRDEGLDGLMPLLLIEVTPRAMSVAVVTAGAVIDSDFESASSASSRTEVNTVPVGALSENAKLEADDSTTGVKTKRPLPPQLLLLLLDIAAAEVGEGIEVEAAAEGDDAPVVVGNDDRPEAAAAAEVAACLCAMAR